jgi:hypothetical protein
MKRILVSTVAVLVANIAAPLLFALVVLTSWILQRPEAFSWNGAFRLVALFGVLGSVPVLRLAFPASLVLAMIGLGLRWRSRRIYLGGGILIGLFFYLTLLQNGASKDSEYLAASIPIGAICGWIYWRIAIGRTPANSHATNAA